jgi:hypothetical protein
MNSFYLRTTVAAVAFFAATSAYAASTTGNASATVVAALSVSQTTPMSFGSFTSNGSTGTVNTNGTFQGGVTKVTDPTPATFTVTGAASQGYSVSGMPQITLTNGTPANDMTVTLFYPANGSQALDGSGSDTFPVNGLLDVAASQPAGSYTGTYTVNVNY